jgi:glycosyltransferase involved in cell wall biosynthesis
MNVPKQGGPGSGLAVVVPMYNEAAAAEPCIRAILAALPTVGIPAGLIVVNDGSTDGTAAQLAGLQVSLGSFRVVHQQNGGYGRALVAGAKAAADHGYDYVLFMDSDLTNPPEHIARFVPPIFQGVDLIKGSRFDSGGNMDAVPWRRRIWSIGANLVARMMFRMGLSDCTNGFRAIRTELLCRMPLRERGFAIILEELYWTKKFGATVISVPTTLGARTKGQRPSAFAYRPTVIWSYLKFALRAAIIRYRINKPQSSLRTETAPSRSSG